MRLSLFKTSWYRTTIFHAKGERRYYLNRGVMLSSRPAGVPHMSTYHVNIPYKTSSLNLRNFKRIRAYARQGRKTPHYFVDRCLNLVYIRK